SAFQDSQIKLQPPAPFYWLLSGNELLVVGGRNEANERRAVSPPRPAPHPDEQAEDDDRDKKREAVVHERGGDPEGHDEGEEGQRQRENPARQAVAEACSTKGKRAAFASAGF